MGRLVMGVVIRGIVMYFRCISEIILYRGLRDYSNRARTTGSSEDSIYVGVSRLHRDWEDYGDFGNLTREL